MPKIVVPNKFTFGPPGDRGCTAEVTGVGVLYAFTRYRGCMGAPIAVGYEDDAEEHHGHDREGDQCFANEVSESPHVKSISYEKGRLHR